MQPSPQSSSENFPSPQNVRCPFSLQPEATASLLCLCICLSWASRVHGVGPCSPLCQAPSMPRVGAPVLSHIVLVPPAAESTPGCGCGCSGSFPHWGHVCIVSLFVCEDYCCSARQQTRLCVDSGCERGLGGKHSVGIDNAGKSCVLDFRSVSGVRWSFPKGVNLSTPGQSVMVTTSHTGCWGFLWCRPVCGVPSHRSVRSPAACELFPNI